jgi:hypothetical protein
LSRSIADSDARPAFQVLERTFGILEVFTESQPEWSTTQVARELDLPVPTVHRILAALKRLGYVSQHEESRRFRLGMASGPARWPTSGRSPSARCGGYPTPPVRRRC